MNETNNGGPAFPALESSWVDREGQTRYETSGGVTLRDYAIIKFAAAWTITLGNRNEIAGYSDTESAYEALRLATKQADAMLAERAKPTGGA